MSKKKELAIYGVLLFVISAGAFVSHRMKHRGTCCEAALGESVEWNTVNPPDDDTAGFGSLVWVKTRNGIQLRFSYTIAQGQPWTPLVAPAGTQDSRQSASLRALFGGK